MNGAAGNVEQEVNLVNGSMMQNFFSFSSFDMKELPCHNYLILTLLLKILTAPSFGLLLGNSCSY
jgi:hypothetical protein